MRHVSYGAGGHGVGELVGKTPARHAGVGDIHVRPPYPAPCGLSLLRAITQQLHIRGKELLSSYTVRFVVQLLQDNRCVGRTGSAKRHRGAREGPVRMRGARC